MTPYSVSALTAGTGRWRTHPDGTGPGADDICGVAAAMARDGIITTIDTANNYGFGESERWVRRALAHVAGQGTPLFVQTKADRARGTTDFSGPRIRRSLEESLERLGLDRLPLVFLHDPEFTTWDDVMSPGGAVETLVRARTEGIIGALGISAGPPRLLERFIATGVFDAMITHNRHTLVDTTADSAISAAASSGIGVYNAAPYGGGFLTAWPPPTTVYAYQEATPEQRERLRRVAQVCRDHDVPLAAAALQWSLRDPRITSTIVGLNTVADYDRTIELAHVPIPDSLWSELTDEPAGRENPSPKGHPS